jgi:hypothetical protein
MMSKLVTKIVKFESRYTSRLVNEKGGSNK